MTAVDESYNLSFSELQGLRRRARENAKDTGQRDGRMTDRDGQRDGQTEIWTNRDRRTYGYHWHPSTNTTMPCRQRDEGGVN